MERGLFAVRSMDSLSPVAEGLIVGCFTALILALICGLIIVVRRHFRNGANGPEKGYRRIDIDNSLSEQYMGRKRILPITTTSSLVTPQPAAVTWAKPLVAGPRKLRSSSCPDRKIAPTLHEGEGIDEHGEQKVQTPQQQKRRRSKRRTRAKTDGCYHVCQIQFSILYDFYQSKLYLKLVCAVNIPSTFGVTYGSYIKVELFPSSEKASTDIQFHTNNPVFNETVEFPEIGHDELLNKSLRLRLYTMDRFSHSSFVGQVVAPFAEFEINPAKPTTIWRPISQNDNQSPRAVSSKEILDRGELFVSLRYTVSSNKVTVVVMKAANLPQGNKIFAIDPYVIVKLMLNLKTVQTKKTPSKRRTTSPCWNELLVFEIDEKIPISEYSFYFKVKSHNNLSEDPTLGEVEIGYHADGLGREHWKDMIVKKNQDRAMCHKIK